MKKQSIQTKGRTMKKTVIILATLITLSMVGGSLYKTLANLTRVDNDVREYASLNQFPYNMRDVVMDPMPGMQLY